MNQSIPHIPVLFNETIEAFSNCEDGYIIDCTLGYGGHSQGLLEAYPNIKLICNDQDDTALEFSKKRLEKYKDRIIFNKGNFQTVVQKYEDKNIVGILADIGVSSLQLDEESRGFSFDSDILDMRMDQGQDLSANDIVNNYDQTQLEYIFKEYGEVREYKKAASLVVQNRPFSSAKDLANMFSKNLYKNKIHPATLPFQAIRIEVNNELGVLEDLFNSIENSSLNKCMVAIISFHSLEDRIVKNYFKKWSKKCICPQGIYRCECGNNHQKGKTITKKPIIPTKGEIKVNPRSRSSKLRVFKIDKKDY